MIRSREIALRRAASLPSNLLLRGWKRHENEREIYGIKGPSRPKHSALISQLESCQSDEARRLILGRSK